MAEVVRRALRNAAGGSTRDHSRDLVDALHTLIEGGRLGPRGRTYVETATTELRNAAGGLVAAGDPACVELRAGVLWVAERRFSVDARTFPAYSSCVQWLRKQGIGRLEFSGGDADLAVFAGRLGSEYLGDEPIPGVSWTSSTATTGRAAPTSPLGPSASTGSRLGSVFLSRPLVDAAVEMGVVDLRVAKGIVQGVVERLHNERALLPGLTRLQAGGRPVLRHAAAVCLFAVLLGRRIGLPEEILLALGAGGLLHDIGRVEGVVGSSEDESIERPRRQDPAGLDEGHAAAGFVELIRAGCRSDLELRTAEIVRRHHEPLSAAPLGHPDGPGLLPAIVGFADRFDRASHVGGRFVPEAGLWELRRAVLRDEVPNVLLEMFVPALEQAASIGRIGVPETSAG
jgi:hypothetical protein